MDFKAANGRDQLSKAFALRSQAYDTPAAIFFILDCRPRGNEAGAGAGAGTWRPLGIPPDPSLLNHCSTICLLWMNAHHSYSHSEGSVWRNEIPMTFPLIFLSI